MDISAILSRRFKGSEWALNGDAYSGLIWLSQGEAPSESEIEALWLEVSAEIDREIIENRRKIAYQRDSDPLFFAYQRGEATEAEWLAAVQAVKDANPYPETV